MATNKKTFEVELDGKKVTMAVVRPNSQVKAKAAQIYGKTFADLVNAQCIVRPKVNAIMRQQGLWDEDREKQFQDLGKAILKAELSLKNPTGTMKLEEGKKIAVQMRRDRWALFNLTRDRNSLDANSAETQAENARFNYLITACTVYDKDGKPFYKDVEDFLAKENDPVAEHAGKAMQAFEYGLDEEYEQKLPENKFLKKYKLVDEKLRFIDKNGHFVDHEGNPVDEKGRRVNDKGELIDLDGNPITEEGEYKVEEKPFLDEDGNPIIV